MGKMFRTSNDFSSDVVGPILLKFHVEPPCGRERKVAKISGSIDQDGLPCPYMVKTFKNLLL